MVKQGVADIAITSKDGVISEKGYVLDMSIVAKSGEFSKAITYGDVVDMTFVKKHAKNA